MSGAEWHALAVQAYDLAAEYRYVVVPAVILLGLGLSIFLTRRRIQHVREQCSWCWDEDAHRWHNPTETVLLTSPTPGEDVGPEKVSRRAREAYGTEQDWLGGSCIGFVFEPEHRRLHVGLMRDVDNPWEHVSNFLIGEMITVDRAFAIRIVPLPEDACFCRCTRQLHAFMDRATTRRWAKPVEDGAFTAWELAGRSPVDAADDITRNVLR